MLRGQKNDDPSWFKAKLTGFRPVLPIIDSPITLTLLGRTLRFPISLHLKFLIRFVVVLLVLDLSSSPVSAVDSVNLGLLFDQSPLVLEPGTSTEVLGPFFNYVQPGPRDEWAVPPLCSRIWDTSTGFNEFDVLYPLVTYRRYGTEHRFQILQIFRYAGGQNQHEDEPSRLTLFPIYFQQRSKDTNLNYTAVFPFYGNIKARLFRDEIFFVMFPLYGQTRKRDVVTDNILYPLFQVEHGDGLYGWHVWPLVGHEHKIPTLRTNGFNDIQAIGGEDNRFFLWPLYLRREQGIGTENPEREQAIFPFYDYLRSPDRDSTTILWPLFNHITDRAKNYREWQVPFPLIEFARGEGKTGSRVFPFYSHMQNTNLESAFFLWPLYKYNRMRSGALERERTRIMFFLYSDTKQKNLETGAALRRIDFWPFYSVKRDYKGNSSLQAFAPLEPLAPYSKHFERDYSPLWSIWRVEKNEETGASSESLFWNLYRYNATPASKKCSLLFGLFQYQSGSDGKRLRLLYIPVFKTRPTAATHAK